MLLAAVAGVLGCCPAQAPWLFEGATRRLVRALLCRDGYAWPDADVVAARLIGQARREIPAGHDVNPLPLVNACAHCGRPLADWRPGTVYCSESCRAMNWRRRLQDGVRRDVERTALCALCQAPFTTTNSRKLFCTHACAARATNRLRPRARELHQPRPCAHCGAEFAPVSTTQRYCATRCSRASLRARKREMRALGKWT